MGSKSGGCNSSTRDDDNINKNNLNKKGGSEEKLDYWRKYFRSVKKNSDIFDIIEHAIMVAASDYPNEYRVKKSGIAELLFTCRMTRCSGCDRVELATPHDHVGVHDDVDVDIDVDVDVGGGGDDDVEIDIDGNEGGVMEMNGEMIEPCSNFSYGDAEALNDLIEEEKQLINEVLRIKDILYNSKDESDSVLFESLRRLQLMHLTINILKETEIGKAVNHIRRHSSKEIRNLSRSLIDGWKIIVDEWVKSTQELAEGGTPDSINPSTVDEEEGLPSPPMDDGVFFSTQTMDFNQFFDGVDDDLNPRNSGEFNNRESGRKPSIVKKRDIPPKETTPVSKDNRPLQTKMQPPVQKPSKPVNTQSGPGRPVNRNEDAKFSKDSKVRPKLEKPVVQRKPAPQPEKPRLSNEDSVQDKLEATKRKLQERYQQAENAKKQRTIQVMEIQDLPKQAVLNKNPQGRFGNQNRHWANTRK
ncbi:hypothetical protein RND81_12G011100 [Saponaria officinalis]|uniref:TFIIS N-terminal domain-containing protein n=1 Tax=Saponaria officinalis TaxID=3572 RepID=A0AAW1H3Y3_SAPOF